MSPCSRQKLPKVLVVRSPQFGGIAFKRNHALAQHDELGLVRLLRIGPRDAEAASFANGLMVGGEERVAQLMGHNDRTDAFQIAQLDYLLVDGERRDWIQTGRRLVVQQNLGPVCHRAGNRDASSLTARQLRRASMS